jgi:hypothetical protein
VRGGDSASDLRVMSCLALKFTEACLREHRLNPQPVYLAAAEDWAARLHRAKNWTAAELAAAGIDFQ